MDANWNVGCVWAYGGLDDWLDRLVMSAVCPKMMKHGESEGVI